MVTTTTGVIKTPTVAPTWSAYNLFIVLPRGYGCVRGCNKNLLHLGQWYFLSHIWSVHHIWPLAANGARWGPGHNRHISCCRTVISTCSRTLLRIPDKIEKTNNNNNKKYSKNKSYSCVASCMETRTHENDRLVGFISLSTIIIVYNFCAANPLFCYLYAMSQATFKI